MGGKRICPNAEGDYGLSLRRHHREPTGATMKKAHRKGQQRKKRRQREVQKRQRAAWKAGKA